MIPGLRGRRMAGNVALNLLGHGLPLLAALPAVPLLIQGAGVERFGLLTIAWVVVGYVGLFDLGMGRALTHAVADRVGRGRSGEVAGLLQLGTLVALALSVVAAGALALAGPALVGLLNLEGDPAVEAVPAVWVLALTVPFVVVTAVLRGGLEGLHRFGMVNAVRIPMGVATFLAPLAVLVWSHHLAALVAGLLAARVLGWAGYAWALRWALRGEAFRRPVSAAPGVREPSDLGGLLRYGGWATVSNLVSPLMVHFDRVVIGAVLTAAAVAHYTTPFDVAHRLLVIPGAVVAVFFPAFSALRNAPEVAARFLGDAAGGILILMVPPAALLFALAPEALELWVGSEFADAGAAPARWLLVGMVVNGVAHVPFVFVQGVGRPDVTAWIHLVEAPVYALALLWALPRWGLPGAAAIWTARVSVDLLLLSVASWRLNRDAGPVLARALGLTLIGAGVVAGSGWAESLEGRMALVASVWIGVAAVAIGWAKALRSAPPTAPAGRGTPYIQAK